MEQDQPEEPAQEQVAERMRMNDEQIERVSRWIEEKVTETCPMCSAEQWQFRPQMMVLPFVDPKTGEGLRASYGVVPLECGECGFLAQFSALAIGLAD